MTDAGFDNVPLNYSTTGHALCYVTMSAHSPCNGIILDETYKTCCYHQIYKKTKYKNTINIITV